MRDEEEGGARRVKKAKIGIPGGGPHMGKKKRNESSTKKYGLFTEMRWINISRPGQGP